MNNIEKIIETFKKLKEKEIENYIILKDENFYNFCIKALTLMNNKDKLKEYINYMHDNPLYGTMILHLTSLIIKLEKLDKKKKYNIGFKYQQFKSDNTSIRFEFGVYNLDDEDFLDEYKNRTITKFHFNTEIITHNEVMLNVKYKDIRDAVLYKFYRYLYESHNYNVYEL